jgi:saccharopine dehydrogenase-like NADP-dependent oxidoreductase
MDGIHLIVAGRDSRRAQAMADTLRTGHGDNVVEGLALDIDAPDFTARLRDIAPDVVAHTGGPFQSQDYRVARACIAAGVHYVDLADARRFVCDIATLDAAAQAANVLVVSGASSVPALSGAAVERLATDAARVDTIDIGINPGNKTERGLATVRAILGYCGASFDMLRDGRHAPTIGWLKPRRVDYPSPVGPRYVSDCDVPDLELLPRRYPTARHVIFGGGLELTLLHWGMSVLAWWRKLGLVRDWAHHANCLKPLSDLFLPLGTAGGAMHVIVQGTTTDGARLERRWFLVAVDGDGPYVPTLAAAAVIRALKEHRLEQRGALPCLGLLDLDHILAEAEGLAIHTVGP